MTQRFSSPAMERLAIPTTPLAKKVPSPTATGDGALDFIKHQQRQALVETVDMMCQHPHIRQSVRDFAHGLLATASNQKEAFQHDHFEVAPDTMGKVDKEFIAGIVCKYTQLTLADVSKCRAFDTKFCQKMWLLLMNSMGAVKLPAECKSKPVLAGIAKKRITDLGNRLANVKVNGVDVLTTGKVNWGRIGMFRATVGPSGEGGPTIITEVTHVYSGAKVNVAEEGITEDFVFDMNWNSRQAVLMRGTRKHVICDFFKTAEQKKAIAPWCGKCQSLQEIASEKNHEIKQRQASEGSGVTVNRTDLLKETAAKRSQAISDAKAKLAEARERNAKSRRISVAEGKA